MLLEGQEKSRSEEKRKHNILDTHIGRQFFYSYLICSICSTAFDKISVSAFIYFGPILQSDI